jgi:hypothetical protein
MKIIRESRRKSSLSLSLSEEILNTKNSLKFNPSFSNDGKAGILFLSAMGRQGGIRC